jgi:hypothetical protein
MREWLRRPSVLASLAAVLVVLAVLVMVGLKTLPDCWRAHPDWTAAQCLTDLARRTAPPAIRKLLPPQLTLSWTDNSGGSAGVKVERKTGTAGTYAQIAELPAGTTSLVDPAVATATTYCYRVKAFSAEGESGYTPEACGTVGSGTFAVTVSLSGTGSVASAPSGIACPTACHTEFPSGSLVTLSASGVGGSTFSGWSGACSGTAPCAITGNVPVSVTATFAAAPPTSPLTLTVGVSGSGTVTSTPAGIACPATSCSASFPAGTAVSMTATAASGWTFYSWSGGLCSGSVSCLVTTSGLVVANFSSSSPPPPPPPPTTSYTLTVAISGQGAVASSPAGIACGADCSGSYPAGTAVTLTGVPRSGWQLTGWSVPGCSGLACTITVNGNVTVSAKFARQKKL